MRFKSKKTKGYIVYAVSGTNSVSFAIDFANGANTGGLLGFAIEREDLIEKERYFMPNFKVFKEMIPDPGPDTFVSSFEHPVQSFVWDDFSAKPGYDYNYYFYPVKGSPKNLKREKPIKISVSTERIFDAAETHEVFFNRGVASSQAYIRRFQNQAPGDIEDPKKRQDAYHWLGRDLPTAMFKFIEQAKNGDTLLACVYEFRYLPVVQAFKTAIDKGVNVQIIMDAKDNKEDFPREENLKAVKTTGIPKGNIIFREARKSEIQHNKFIVFLKGTSQIPTAVWTGSTNISEGGIFGQTNVGHWVRDKTVASQYKAYWDILSKDPGGQPNDDRAIAMQKNKSFRQAVERLQRDFDPANLKSVPVGISTIFSPRPKETMLDVYGAMLDQAGDLSCITLAFGINDKFKALLSDNTPASHLTFMLLEQKDKPTKEEQEKGTFIRLNAKHNVYAAFGSFIKDPLYQWAKETNAAMLKLNKHVLYIHSKFLLMDPLGNDPVIVTGSANFSSASTTDNDENMLIIRGNKRAADIYFTEFNRLFFHYYFRSVHENLRSGKPLPVGESLFLKSKAEEWLAKYAPGEFRHKRVQIFTKMKGTRTLNFGSLT